MWHFEKSGTSEQGKPEMISFYVASIVMFEKCISQILRKKNGLIRATNIKLI